MKTSQKTRYFGGIKNGFSTTVDQYVSAVAPNGKAADAMAKCATDFGNALRSSVNTSGKDLDPVFADLLALE
jgi:putative IMPACT (imprinted ancient) family translation regulator